MFANQLKSLIERERIVTTVEKAKELRRHADRMITIAKKNTLAARRDAIGKLMIRYNSLDSKQMRAAKEGSVKDYNTDRQVIGKLFTTLGPRFSNRNGGYTRLIKSKNRVGDNAQECIVEFLSE
ncbi:MAG: 50S ribosomal protein L17 [Chlamydiales bacterium]|nr:50S ribosomal protein L17 [Chlamydiales bacterium]MCH9619792.1 50S ribosomal protein L17 [Chlamydiales bacterium]MCH9623398.1 50S ribosomal protein L17 [Chlamydiales bacterium]